MNRSSNYILLLVLPMAACSKSAQESPPRTGAMTTSMTATMNTTSPDPMTAPRPRPNANAGTSHALTPRDALLGWLKKNARRKGRRTFFRLPVVISTKNSFGLGRDKSFVGTSTTDPGTDKLHLDLDDSALGLSLDSRLQSKCDKKAKVCALWIEGQWGPFLNHGPRIPPTPSKKPRAHPFAVRKVGNPIPPKTKSARAQIIR